MITRRGLLVLGRRGRAGDAGVGAVGLGWPVFVAANLVAAAVLAADWRAADRPSGIEVVRGSSRAVLGRPGQPGHPGDALAVRPAAGREVADGRAGERLAGTARAVGRARPLTGSSGSRSGAGPAPSWPDPSSRVRLPGAGTARSRLQPADGRSDRRGRSDLARRPAAARRAAASGRTARQAECESPAPATAAASSSRLRAYVPGRRVPAHLLEGDGPPGPAGRRQPAARATAVAGARRSRPGRLMAGGGGDGLGKLDRAINACVMLSAVAREFDDAVGAITFDHQPQAGAGRGCPAGAGAARGRDAGSGRGDHLTSRTGTGRWWRSAGSPPAARW